MSEEGEHEDVSDDVVDEGEDGRRGCPRKKRKKTKGRG